MRRSPGASEERVRKFDRCTHTQICAHLIQAVKPEGFRKWEDWVIELVAMAVAAQLFEQELDQ
jgi:hypothetical protein